MNQQAQAQHLLQVSQAHFLVASLHLQIKVALTQRLIPQGVVKQRLLHLVPPK